MYGRGCSFFCSCLFYFEQCLASKKHKTHSVSWNTEISPAMLNHLFIVTLPTLRNYFLIYHMNFDYCLQTKEKNKNKKHSTVMSNFYFLVLDWLNLMIVWMFVLESWQVGNVGNCEPQTQWLSVNARLDTLSLNFPVY